MKADYTLYLVTDRKYTDNKNGDTKETLCAAVEQALLGGCTMIQLREKNLPTRDFYCLAEKVKMVTDKYCVPLIINDRIDIALAVGAAGIHIGQEDMPALAARRIVGPEMLIGISVSTEKEALQAWRTGADYLGVGAVFPTKSKKDAKEVSVETLKAVRKTVPIPIVAIGGINEGNAAELMKLGIDGVAVVSAILTKSDVRKAAEDLKGLLHNREGCCN